MRRLARLELDEQGSECDGRDLLPEASTLFYPWDRLEKRAVGGLTLASGKRCEGTREVWHLPHLNLLKTLTQELQSTRKRPFTPQLGSLISQTRMWFTFLSQRWPSCALMLCA